MSRFDPNSEMGLIPIPDPSRIDHPHFISSDDSPFDPLHCLGIDPGVTGPDWLNMS